MVKHGGGEYVQPLLMSDGTVRVFSQNTITPTLQAYPGLDSITDVEGGQYHSEALDQRGCVYRLDKIHTNWVKMATDTTGAEFKDNFFIRGIYAANVSIRGTDSTIWYWGDADPLGVGAGIFVRPFQLTQPSGKKFKSLQTSTNKITALASDGTLWQYSFGSMTAVNITPSGKTITRFGVAGPYGILAFTSDNLILAKGMFDGRYVGQATHNTSWVDITSTWLATGLTLPVKEIACGYNYIGLIDANDHYFASGSNTMGNIGNGYEHPLLKTPFRTSSAWSVDIAENGFELQAPTRAFQGKVKNVCASTTIAFQTWLKDLNDNWYSWGRNKGFNLGNGTSIGPYAGWGGTGNYSDYPNAKDIPVPQKRTPLVTPYVLVNFAIEDDQPPVVSAGIGQYNLFSSSSTLYGVVHQQEFTITSTTWSKFSGPAGGSITSPASLTTGITGLTPGTYVYRLTVLNSAGLTSTNDVDVVVSSVGGITDNLRGGTIYRN